MLLAFFDPAAGATAVEPPASGAGNWAGAPSALADGDRLLVAFRRRRSRGGPPPDRGYELCVAESGNGERLEPIWSLRKEELGSASLERACLRRAGGAYRLYLSYEHPDDGRWRIDVVEAPSPDAFDVATARTVLTPAATGTAAVKDPYVVGDEGGWLMYVSTFLTDAGPAPTWLAASSDGIAFRWLGEALGVGARWDAYQARLSTAMPTADGWIGLYDGAASAAEDTEERLGLARSEDGRRWRSASADAPWRVSRHASGSLRYADAVEFRGQRLLFYEYARADGSHELRVSRLGAAGRS